MERKKITITVHKWREDFRIPLVDFVSQLNGLLLRVPPDHTAMIDFDTEGDDYDFASGELSVCFVRDETEDELRARQESEASSRDWHQARELAELARLKAKYPGSA